MSRGAEIYIDAPKKIRYIGSRQNTSASRLILTINQHGEQRVSSAAIKIWSITILNIIVINAVIRYMFK